MSALRKARLWCSWFGASFGYRATTQMYLFYCLVLFCFVLFCFVLFCFVLFCFVLFCFVLFCFVLFCFVLFCFVLFCFVFDNSTISTCSIVFCPHQYRVMALVFRYFSLFCPFPLSSSSHPHLPSHISVSEYPFHVSTTRPI